MDKKSIPVAVLLFISAMILSMELLLRRSVQIIIQNEQTYVQEITGIYTITDVLIVAIFSSMMTACVIYLLLPQKREIRIDVPRDLKEDEKKIYNLIVESGGVIFQGELVEKSGLSKSSVSLILDRLEAKGLVERRRHGMSNVVILKGR